MALKSIYPWAARWGIPHEAIADLINELNFGVTSSDRGLSEAGVQSRVRLEASEKGLLMWRNNVGALRDSRGRTVRYGLANDSDKVNALLKSADLVGIRKTLITQTMVGSYLGVFTCREIKESGWVPDGSDHEQAQLNFALLVLAYGGDAGFANDVGTL